MVIDIYNELFKEAYPLLAGLMIRDAVYGEKYCACETEAGVGVAYLNQQGYSEMRSPSDINKFIGADAIDIAELYLKGSAFEISFALAVMNTVLSNRGKLDDKSAYNSVITQESVAMVGYFKPIIEDVRSSCKNLFIFELKGIEGAYSPEDAERILPKCGGVIITGATLANKTIHQYLPFLRKNAEIIITGPSTPLADTLSEYANLTGAMMTDKSYVFDKVRKSELLRGDSIKRVILTRSK